MGRVCQRAWEGDRIFWTLMSFWAGEWENGVSGLQGGLGKRHPPRPLGQHPHPPASPLPLLASSSLCLVSSSLLHDCLSSLLFCRLDRPAVARLGLGHSALLSPSLGVLPRGDRVPQTRWRPGEPNTRRHRHLQAAVLFFLKLVHCYLCLACLFHGRYVCTARAVPSLFSS